MLTALASESLPVVDIDNNIFLQALLFLVQAPDDVLVRRLGAHPNLPVM